MSSQRDDRVIDLSVEVPGTPEEVWATIATGPGIGSWFIPHVVEEREGGRVEMDFGSYGTEEATVAAWEPPHRVVFRSGGERPLAYEWLVEARSGGTCVVRLVNSGFGPDESWDADFEGMSEGWRIFLANLRLHLTHFRGQRARALTPTGALAGPNVVAFATLCEQLGVGADLRPGDGFEASGEGVPPLAGTVHEVLRSEATSCYLLVVDEPVPGTAFVAVEGKDPDRVAASTYLYLHGNVPDGYGEAWERFFADRFAPVQAG